MQLDTNCLRREALPENIAVPFDPADEADLIVVRIAFDLRSKTIDVSVEKTKSDA
jgi:hypothetical protein